MLNELSHKFQSSTLLIGISIHLTADLFDYFVIEIPNLGPSKGFVVDFIRECALMGSLDLLSDVIREYSLIEYDDGWKGSFDWSSYDQLELQNYIRGDE